MNGTIYYFSRLSISMLCDDLSRSVLKITFQVCRYTNICHWTWLWSRHTPIPEQCSEPLAGVVSLAHMRRPAVGAAPDGSPVPAVPDVPGWAVELAHCAPPPARYVALSARRSAPVALPLHPHATPPAPGDRNQVKENKTIIWHSTDPRRNKVLHCSPSQECLMFETVRCLIAGTAYSTLLKFWQDSKLFL